MRVKTKTDDTLILRGYTWWRLALAIVGFLMTPLWILIAAQFSWEMVILALIGPTVILSLTHKTYDNWQLVLQAEYSEAALYKAPWGHRQRARTFDLARIDKAVIDTEVHGKTSYFWGTREERIHHLALVFKGSKHKTRIGIGSHNDVFAVAGNINSWLAYNKHRAAIAEKECA